MSFTKPEDVLFKTGNGKVVFEVFPQEYRDLDAELKTEYHPKLSAVLAGINMDDMDLKIAHIASYCEVVLDGAYDVADRTKLCGVLVKKLKEKREDPEAQTIILLP